jgi:hypothetical protein
MLDYEVQENSFRIHVYTNFVWSAWYFESPHHPHLYILEGIQAISGLGDSNTLSGNGFEYFGTRSLWWLFIEKQVRKTHDYSQLKDHHLHFVKLLAVSALGLFRTLGWSNPCEFHHSSIIAARCLLGKKDANGYCIGHGV